MPQKELSRLSGRTISESWLNKFVNHRRNNPSVGSLIALEEALDRAERK